MQIAYTLKVDKKNYYFLPTISLYERKIALKTKKSDIYIYIYIYSFLELIIFDTTCTHSGNYILKDLNFFHNCILHGIIVFACVTSGDAIPIVV
jgi:hypothetical protein